jgi:hypothetical protein
MKMHERRPAWLRIRDFLMGLPGSIRKVPGVPATTVAVLLGLAIGVGTVALSGRPPGGDASTGGRPFGFPQVGARNNAPNPSSQFSGPLPSPALDQPNATFPTATINGAYYNASYSLYFGPTTLTWAGKLVVTATNLPVYRFQEPTRPEAVRFAASIGASPAPQLQQEGLGTYSGHNIVLFLSGSTRFPGREPTFRFNDPTPNGGIGDVSDFYLRAHGLFPTWPYQLGGDQSIDSKFTRITYLRLFDLGAQGEANLIDGVGSFYGTEVDLIDGQLRAVASGPLPLDLDATTFPIITAEQAISSALAQSAQAGNSSVPAVQLTGAELVYKLVNAGDHSFYEPAFLFAGLFTDNGTTYVKRVLVPAVDAGDRSS